MKITIRIKSSPGWYISKFNIKLTRGVFTILSHILKGKVIV